MNISAASPCRAPIWDRSPEEVAYWSSTLRRVISIRNVLFEPSPHSPELKTCCSPLQNSKFLMETYSADYWTSFHQELTTGNYPESLASEKLEACIARFPLWLQSFYQQEFRETEGDIAFRINRLVKDVFSAMHLSVRESFRGNDGVLLLRHTRAGADSIPKWIESSVIKWTTPLELASCTFLNFFSDDIYVPQASILDFDQRAMIRSNSTVMLSEECSTTIQDNLTFLRSHFSAKETAKGSIMIAERVNGANLADFVINDWEELTPPQKNSIYSRIASLAFIDLLMGNRDRFTMFDIDFTDFDEFFEANIGNLMIHFPESEKEGIPILSAIDNEVQFDNLPGGDDYERYNHAFQQLMRNSEWTKTMSTAIMQGLKNSFKMSSFYFEEIQDNRPQTEAKLRQFISELDEPEVQSLMIEALLKAHASLEGKLQAEDFFLSLDSLCSKYSAVFKDEQSPLQLLNGIKVRINIFSNYTN